MQLLTKLCEGLGMKGKVGAECYGRVWFLTPHPCNHPPDCLTPLTWQTGVILLHFQTSGQTEDSTVFSKLFSKYETDCFQRLFSFLSLISFPSEWVYHLFCLICCIKYRVNSLYNMKLSNQLTIINFYPPPQKLLFGSSSQKLEISRIPIPSNGTLPRLPTLRNISSSGES